MREIDLIIQTLETTEKTYGVQIVLKDCYSIMTLPTAEDQKGSFFAPLHERFWGHNNPYCMYIKSDPGTQKECAAFGNTGMGRRFNHAPTAYERGTCVDCPFGVKEFYYPVRCAGHVIGALVMGYAPCDNRRFALDYAASRGLDADTLCSLYESDILPHTVPQTSSDACRNVALCAEMLSLLCDKLLGDHKIDALFKYDFILDRANVYLYPDENKPFFSRSDTGENRKLTVILNAISYICEHYTEKMTVAEIAKYCYCSESTLTHFFHRYYGMSITHLIRSIRLEQARELLCDTSLSVGEVASRCGFSAQDYFASVFRRQYGINPTDYRR